MRVRVLVLLLVAAVCFLFLRVPSPVGVRGVGRVTLGYSALRISLPVFVAQERGYFKAHGLDIVLQRFDTAQPLMQALLAGTIDAGGYVAFPIVFSTMQRAQEDVEFLTAMVEDQSHRVSSLLVAAGSSTDLSLEDLAEKRVGVLPTLAYQRWIQTIFKMHAPGGPPGRIVPIAPALQPSALRSGQVAALFTNDPVATTIVQQGYGRLLSEEVLVPQYFGDPFLFGTFVLDKDFAAENPAIVSALQQALDDAIAYIHQHPEEAKRQVLPYVHASQRAYVTKYPDAKYLSSSELRGEAVQRLADKYFELEVIPARMRVESLVR